MARNQSVTASSVKTPLTNGHAAKASRQPSSKKQKTPSPDTHREVFHGLLHQIDPRNHDRTAQCGYGEEFHQGFVCHVDLPPVLGEESGSVGKFVVSVLFAPSRCEVWLGFDADETYQPYSPLASYAYSDAAWLGKLFRRLEALGLHVPGDFWTKLNSGQPPVK